MVSQDLTSCNDIYGPNYDDIFRNFECSTLSGQIIITGGQIGNVNLTYISTIFPTFLKNICLN